MSKPGGIVFVLATAAAAGLAGWLWHVGQWIASSGVVLLYLLVAISVVVGDWVARNVAKSFRRVSEAQVHDRDISPR